MEIVTSWMEEGMAKGRDEGLAKGRDAMAQAVVALLGRRVGDLPAAVEKKVRGLGLEELQALAVALLDFGSVRDLKRWLASRG